MNLLIADDEYVIRTGLCSLDWSSVGIQNVYSAENGVEARDCLEKEQVDLLISDIRMPGLTGLELAAYLRQYAKETLVIILTGFGEFEYAQEALRSQVFEYLLKPVNPEELLAAAHRAVQWQKQMKYQHHVMREYENGVGSCGTKEQILKSFGRMNPQVAAILEELADKYCHDITLAGLAKEHHFTSIYLSRLIKKETGYGFTDLITAIRLMNVLDLLQEEKVKIGNICERTGFRDQRYFSQVFRRVFGCTPGEYKKQGSIRRYSVREILEVIHEKKQSTEA